MSARIRSRVARDPRRSSIAATPPACTHCGIRFFSGLLPAA
jgi:hypothetical protein